MDIDRRVRYVDTHSYPNTYSYSNADTNTDTHPDTNAYSDTHSNARVQSLCRRHGICLEPGRDQCRWVLSMHGTRLVFLDGILVLRTRHWFGMDLRVDSGDSGIVRRYNADTYADADADADSDADSDSDAYSDTYTYTDTDTYTDSDAHPNPNLRRQIRTDRQSIAGVLGKLGRRIEWRASRHGLDSHHSGAGYI